MVIWKVLTMGIYQYISHHDILMYWCTAALSFSTEVLRCSLRAELRSDITGHSFLGERILRLVISVIISQL